MKMFSVLALTLLTFLASGCMNNTDPVSTVNSAYASLMKNQTEDFRGLLSGNALTTYGTPEGMNALKQALVDLSPKVQAAVEFTTGQSFNQKSYSVSVTSSTDANTLILTAYVSCVTTEMGCPSNPVVDQGCSPSLLSACTIDSIQLN
jgi:hypothetical protein